MLPEKSHTDNHERLLKKQAAEVVLKLKKSQKTPTKRCMNALSRKVYISTWISKYSASWFFADLIAGITLGLTMIPQSIAYAILANLPPVYGLYSAFLGSFIYAVFGSVKQVSIGPTNLMCLLMLPATFGKPVQYVFILTLISGCFELLCGVLKLGFFVDFIPIPVTSAFTSVTSLVIIASQLKSVTGMSYLATSFSAYVYKFFEHIQSVKSGDTLLGMGCLMALLLLRKAQDIPVSESNPHRSFIKKALWYITISRNALVVFGASALAYYLTNGGERPAPFKLSGKVASGMPEFSLPSFSVNSTDGKVISFTEIVSDLGFSIFFVPLVAILANVSIAKAFSAGRPVDASQEMLALGLCNILGSFVQSMPTAGAFTRSAVSEASGVKTPLAGIYSGTMTILALSFLTQYFYFIPTATLGAVLITAVVFMIDFKIVAKLYIDNRKDFYSWVVCFLACLVFGVEVGLCIGIVSNLSLLVFYWARPTFHSTVRVFDDLTYVQVRLSMGLLYPGVDHLRNYMNRIGTENVDILKFVVDCSFWSNLDYSSMKGLESIVSDFSTRSQEVYLINVPKHLTSILLKSSKVTILSDLCELRNFYKDF